MKFDNLNSIVKARLLKAGKPIHYYYQYLVYAVDCLQFLTTNTFRNIKSVELEVNEYKAVKTPCDFVDWVKVGFKAGERVRPLIHDSSLLSLYNYDSNNHKIPHNTDTLPDGTVVSEDDRFLDTWLYDEVDFGLRTDRSDYRFKVIPERGEIQLSADYPFSTVILDYIDDGKGANAATQVDTRARRAIDQYIKWQETEDKRGASLGDKEREKNKFWDEVRLLRASTNDLTPEEVVHAVRSGYGAVNW